MFLKRSKKPNLGIMLQQALAQHNSNTYMRPHSECLAMFFNVKAAVSLMCFVTGPSFSSYRMEGKTKAMHEDNCKNQNCMCNYSSNC